MPRPRGTSAQTFRNYEAVRNLVTSSVMPLTQKMVADALDLSPSSVHYVTRKHPFRQAFRTNEHGFLRFVQEPDWFAPSEESVAVTRYSINNYLSTFPSDREVIKRVIDNPPFILRRFKTAVENAKELIGRGRSVRLEMTGEKQVESVKEIEQFAVELLRQVESMRRKPNFGKDEWWLDYVE